MAIPIIGRGTGEAARPSQMDLAPPRRQDWAAVVAPGNVERVMTPQARAIIREVAATCAVTPGNIFTRCRTRAAVHARIEIAKRLRDRGYSTPQIGRVLNRDHTTIVYYLGTAKRTVAPLLWRKPIIRHLNCACCPWPKQPKPPKPAKRYLVPYAGAYPPEYDWKERATNQGSTMCETEQQREFST